MKVTWDIEANKLLNQESIDYTVSPYTLKDSFKIHCIVVEEHDTGLIHAFYDGCRYELDGRRYSETDGDYVYILENYVPVEYTHHQLGDFPCWVKDNTIDVAVAHNGINYDHMVVKLYYGMDYSVYPDSWAGKNVLIEDTLVRSKLQNPDRFGGHSLDKLSEKVGLRKIDFRPDIPKDVRFNTFAADMLYYCIRDVVVNTKVYYWLLEEGSGWDWGDSYELEKAVAELVTRQEHRGFKFDKCLAENNVEELDALMQDRSQKVSPVLPKKPATKGYQKEYTPPVRQFLKTGEPSSYLLKFADKIGANITGTTFNYKFDFNGVVYDTPLPLEPLVTEQEADIEDTTHIKGWLVSEFGWIPSEWKDRDLTVNSKKEKLTNEKFLEAIDRYVEQTLGSPFCKFRCEHLKTTPAKLKAELIKRGNNRSLKVLTNPNFTKGQEKELCPNLELLSERFPYARDVVEYHTYRHRRNSILGGGLDWDDEGEAEKGYLASVREDGRIATPADTCGAATSRFKHRVVANIPRVSSLYGEKMRGLFGVEDGFVQIGYDFDSLEARIEGHYCYRYDQLKDYCQSLLMAKPNDIHSVTARKITEIIGREFGRTPAKSTKYACLPKDNSEVLAKDGWKFRKDLQIGDMVLSYSEDKCCYEWTPIQLIWDYTDAEVIEMKNKWFTIESTADHRWYGSRRRQKGSGKGSVRFQEKGFFTTAQVNSETNIMNASYYWNDCSIVTPAQAALVAWLLSDGHYKWSELKDVTSSCKGVKKGVKASIGQSCEKYWKEIENTLQRNGVGFTKSTSTMSGKDFYTYTLKSKDVRNFLDTVVGSREQKHDADWVKWVLTLDQPALQAFLHNFWLADGHSKDGNKCITQNKGNIADAVMLAGNLTGHRVTFHEKTDKCLNINFSKKAFTTGQRLKKRISRITDVFCITTANGSFVTRQNGVITLTGNCTYGATGPKIAQTIGVDLKTGELVFSAFWEAALPLKKLKDALQKYWENIGGKKFVLGIDKRKVPTRSSHAILNSLFQSAGVICAKRAAVIHDRLLRQEGLVVDFFKEGWKNKTFCQQLIMYHDESQLEVSGSLVKIKTFREEEDAKIWKKDYETRTGKLLSDIGHREGVYYVGYCRAGELAIQAVREAGEYYGLNVELTAGYMLGKNWAECH